MFQDRNGDLTKDFQEPSASSSSEDNFGQFCVYESDDFDDEIKISWEEVQSIPALFIVEEEDDPDFKAVHRSVHIRCLYCLKTYKEMRHMKEHVIGKKDSRKKAWYIPCGTRVREERIPNKGFVPKGTYPPLKYPWCDVICDDQECECQGGLKELQIPEVIERQLNRLHTDLRPNIRFPSPTTSQVTSENSD